MLLILLVKLVILLFMILTQLFSSVKEPGSSLLLKMAVDISGGALVPTLSMAPKMQLRAWIPGIFGASDVCTDLLYSLHLSRLLNIIK